jgi:hypothetical protein
MLDSGANVTLSPEYINQLAVMGSVYFETDKGVNNPTVGLINIGIEETKGTPFAQQEAFPTNDGRRNRSDLDGLLFGQCRTDTPEIPISLFSGANHSQPHSQKTGGVRKVEEHRFSAPSGLYP